MMTNNKRDKFIIKKLAAEKEWKKKKDKVP